MAIQVDVRDRGTPPNNSSTQVIVSVEDANDNPPILVIGEFQSIKILRAKREKDS